MNEEPEQAELEAQLEKKVELEMRQLRQDTEKKELKVLQKRMQIAWKAFLAAEGAVGSADARKKLDRARQDSIAL